MRRHLGIRSKVLAVLGLPVLVLATASGAATYQAMGQADLSHAVGAFAAAQDDVMRVQAALQRERFLSLTVAGDPERAQARQTTDREVAALDAAVARSRIVALAPDTVGAFVAVQNAHSRLPELRRLVDAGVQDEAVKAGYAAVLDADVELPARVGAVVPDRDLGRRLAVDSVLGRAAEASAQATLIGAQVLSLQGTGAGVATPQQQRDLGVALADRARALEAFRADATLSRPLEVTELGAAAAAFDTLAAQIAAGRTPGFGPADWNAAADRQTSALRTVASRVAQDAAVVAETTATTAEQTTALVLAASVAVVGLMVLFALVQSRRITAPLRGLAGVASTTRRRLPAVVEAVVAREPDVELPVIDVTGTDEIGALATAFRDVQDTVLDIAQRQAALRVVLAETFVNVARRNQVLLGRQLALIDRLERTEEDPDALQNLFHLDHLATRMRRNAESLLVLAGIDSGRAARRPMAMTDVVRSAVSEIEQYERVQVIADADPPVVARVALPLAHLLAELVENATQFSDPAAAVVVHVDAAGDTVRVSVRDRGLGMSAAELDDANTRLAAYEDESPVGAEAVGSQRLGLFVVARLAGKLGVRVRLASLGTGTEAVVEVPASLCAADSLLAPAARHLEPAPARPLVPQTVSLPTVTVEPAFEPTFEPVLDPTFEPVLVRAVEPAGVAVADAPPAAEPVATPLFTAPGQPIDVLPKQVQRQRAGLGRLGRISRGRHAQSGRQTSAADAMAGAPHPLEAFAAVLGPAYLDAPPERETLPTRAAGRPVEGEDLGARSALASQALSELSSLVTYRPVVDTGSAPSLARRPQPTPEPVVVALPTQVDVTAAEAREAHPGGLSLSTGGRREARTPDGVRSVLSAFTAGAARGRAQQLTDQS